MIPTSVTSNCGYIHIFLPTAVYTIPSQLCWVRQKCSIDPARCGATRLNYTKSTFDAVRWTHWSQTHQATFDAVRWSHWSQSRQATFDAARWSHWYHTCQSTHAAILQPCEVVFLTVKLSASTKRAYKRSH